MREQIVGLFERKESAMEAARLLGAAGYSPSDLDLVAFVPLGYPGAGRPFLYIRLEKLMERPDGMWPCALKWALVGSFVVEAPVLVWVLLAFDSWGIQVLLASTLWKFGAFFGGMLGAIAGADRGLESRLARRYEEHLGRGALALAARVRHSDTPRTRGLFIESGAYDIRSVEGRFIAKAIEHAPESAPQSRHRDRPR